MRSEEVNNELAGLISRLQHKVRVDPAMPLYLSRDTEDISRELILSGIEDALIGLILLHIQVRRR